MKYSNKTFPEILCNFKTYRAFFSAKIVFATRGEKKNETWKARPRYPPNEFFSGPAASVLVQQETIKYAVLGGTFP